MSVMNIEIVEPQTPLRFRSTDRLREHVKKHLLLGMREERWRRLIDNAWLLEANEEYRRGGYGDCCKELGNAYETLLGAKIVMLCREKRDHAHFASLREDADIALASARIPADAEAVCGQIVEAWDQDSNLFISANCFVRNGGWTPYCLTTGFRLHPELGKDAFARKAAENLAEKIRRRRMKRRLMAVHNNNESGENNDHVSS